MQAHLCSSQQLLNAQEWDNQKGLPASASSARPLMLQMGAVPCHIPRMSPFQLPPPWYLSPRTPCHLYLVPAQAHVRLELCQAVEGHARHTAAIVRDDPVVAVALVLGRLDTQIGAPTLHLLQLQDRKRQHTARNAHSRQCRSAQAAATHSARRAQ